MSPPDGAIGLISGSFGGRPFVATLDAETAVWSVTGLEGESREIVADVLNTRFNPKRDYRGPSDGAFGRRTVAEAAAHFGGEHELRPVAGPDDEERVY